MIGMNENSGSAISGVDHLSQSIARLITTPVGTRANNRDYGSQLPALIDQPMNESNRLKIYASVVDAIVRFERRLIPTRIAVDADTTSPGRFIVTITGIPTTDVGTVTQGSPVELSIPIGWSG